MDEEGEGIRNASIAIVQNFLHPASKDTAPILPMRIHHTLIPGLFKPQPVVLLRHGKARTEARQSIQHFESPFAMCFFARTC